MPTIQHRRATNSQWTALNPVLGSGEIGFELDTNKLKIGNGLATWNTLPYFANEDALNALYATHASVAADIANPETATNSAVLDIVNAAVPGGVEIVVDFTNDVATPRPTWAGGVIWKTTHPTARPFHIAPSGDTIRRLTEVSVGWSPSQLPNLHSWWDAQSITAAADSAVAQWDDLSGNGHHALQSTEAARPIYRAAGLNGHPCVEFDGTDDWLITDPFTPSTAEPFTMYFVGQSTPETLTGGSDFFYGGINAAASATKLDGYRTTAGLLAGSRGTALSGPTLDNGVRRFKIVYNGTNSSITIGDGAPLTGTINQAGIELTRLSLGARADGANFLLGKIGEPILVKGLVSSQDDALVVNYLQDRWGVV